MKYKSIVSIGAHSLDAELLGGPIMIKYAREGSVCTFVHVTKGGLEKKDATEEERETYLNKIKEENVLAAKKMGCQSLALGYLSSELPNQEVFVGLMMDLILEKKADLVITHARGTLHPRHYYTYETVTEAVKRLRKMGHDINLLYGECCEDLVGFIPTLYVSMDESVVESWFDGLGQYAIFNGEVNDVPYQEYYHSMGVVRAIEAGVPGYRFVKAYMHGALIDNE